MGSGIKVRMNSAGARDMLRSGDVASFVDEQGAKVEAAANSMASPDPMRNPAFARSTEAGMNRARCIVSTASTHGVHVNSKYNVLLKCVKGLARGR